MRYNTGSSMWIINQGLRVLSLEGGYTSALNVSFVLSPIASVIIARPGTRKGSTS